MLPDGVLVRRLTTGPCQRSCMSSSSICRWYYVMMNSYEDSFIHMGSSLALITAPGLSLIVEKILPTSNWTLMFLYLPGSSLNSRVSFIASACYRLFTSIAKLTRTRWCWVPAISCEFGGRSQYICLMTQVQTSGWTAQLHKLAMRQML